MNQCSSVDKYNIIKLKTVDSTQLFAIRLLEANIAQENTVVVAENQTAGIGRGNRVWNSKFGNLYFSLIKKNDLHHEISMIIACAIHELFNEYLCASAQKHLTLHWPNDVYFNNKKNCGILITGIANYCIIGIGVNVVSVPELSTAIGLSEMPIQKHIVLDDLLSDILVNIDRWLLLSKNFDYVREYWMNHNYDIGKRITVKNGNDSVSGIYKGINESGQLILSKDDKNVFISSGDMFINLEKVVVNYEK